jgi:hypothetical protein
MIIIIHPNVQVLSLMALIMFLLGVVWFGYCCARAIIVVVNKRRDSINKKKQKEGLV